MGFRDILEICRKKALSERDKGTKFEKLMTAYLKTDKRYAEQFESVWPWMQFPYRKQFSGNDTGIDIVAKTYDGEYWAVQCKFYKEKTTIQKSFIDAFLSTSGKLFADESGNKVGFSHCLWISTSNKKWSKNAEDLIRDRTIPFSRLNLYDLEQAAVDWDKLYEGMSGSRARTEKFDLFDYQKTARDDIHNEFQIADRGKIIMACGTGKTFTSLRIAEHEVPRKGMILFMVPSIALLGQTLREWTAQAKRDIVPICICSDAQVVQDDMAIVDLALPASTDTDKIVSRLKKFLDRDTNDLAVVFSTYQSIDVLSAAQHAVLDTYGKRAEFDLVICDEAHRTTGVTLKGRDESAFTKIHHNENIAGKKRMYMTATPRLYKDSQKKKAAREDAILCSMDDEDMYGREVYRLGFGKAVEMKKLTDYKVMILTIREDEYTEQIDTMASNIDGDIETDDAIKILGCVNALSKQVHGDDGSLIKNDPEPMKRAVAFCQNIKASEKVKQMFNATEESYYNTLPDEKKDNIAVVHADHIDGSMPAPTRDKKLSWLKSVEAGERECRVVNNVRCLSEGVDVPSLDAVLFLSVRNSEIDVVQSVGRVMRTAPGKKYGYIIIPIVIPTDKTPSEALNDSKKYAVIWKILNALRAHDDRFDAYVNKIDMQKKRRKKINVVATGGQRENPEDEQQQQKQTEEAVKQLTLQFEQLQSEIYARIVKKVGSKRYWEVWAQDVADIARRQTNRIKKLIESSTINAAAFQEFVTDLQKNINPAITEDEAIDMISQHTITKPVFDALFENYSFVSNNPISQAIQYVLDVLEADSVERETRKLDEFYRSVKMRVENIDAAEGKQAIIVELYDNFFKTAFPKLVDRLGIVYTPVAVVDFIIHSVNDILQQKYSRSISDKNVHILDPFTGTGTFITRLLQSGLIRQEDMQRKFSKEIHANEIVLLAYYIAAVNIENAYHDISGQNAYTGFNGICLTDTFQMTEWDDSNIIASDVFPKNAERVNEQKNTPIQVIIGNPPYSAGQRSANDNAQNQTYEKLDTRIAITYARKGTATNKNALYDSYMKAFRWSTDRLDPNTVGIICYVSNGSWIDGNTHDGFRKCLEDEFSDIYVFNLRGNARTQGEKRRKEKGNVFGAGTRTTITITLLIKDPNSDGTATIHYHDIGDYLSRQEKLETIKEYKSISTIPWKHLTPNKHGDWINKRSDVFGEYIPIGDKTKKDAFFIQGIYCRGLETSRDVWVYNSNRKKLIANIQKSIDFFNEQAIRFIEEKKTNKDVEIENFISYDNSKISWSRAFIADAKNAKKKIYNEKKLTVGLYRPFCKQQLYFCRELNNVVSRIDSFFPTPDRPNRVICVSGKGVTKEFSCMITDIIPDLEIVGKSQCFPLYYYEKNNAQQLSVLEEEQAGAYTRRDGVSDYILSRAHDAYGAAVTKEDIFYYVYGLLHSPEYRKTFSNDLKKMLPRLPLVDDPEDFWSFSKAGRKLADLHINYESVSPHPDVTVTGEKKKQFRVSKMYHPKDGKKKQKSTIIYNEYITVENIPQKAYEYVVNGKSAIAWIMERYQIKTDKKSGITNDPNDWCKEANNPRYILDLLCSVIHVSTKTVDIVNSLPEVSFE